MAEVSGKPTKFEAKGKTSAVDKVWSLWTDVDSCAKWDKGLKKLSWMGR